MVLVGEEFYFLVISRRNTLKNLWLSEVFENSRGEGERERERGHSVKFYRTH